MLESGKIIAGRYEVESKIGTGGMSDVYKAKDHTLGRYVAIKVLKEEFCEDMNFVTKFRTEAQSAAGLEHPNIVNIYDVGSQEGFHYIIMEYVEGITLKTYIEKKGQLNYKETLSIAIQVSRGIQAAHAKNIIHRDIKPQNIMISRDGKVKVTDFGIARAVSEHTIHSDVMGSVHYASPEQARNGYVSNRSDIYSLGIVMYEMITGRVPFDGESTVAVAIKHLQDEMVPPSEYAPDIPISLEKIILKCTQKSADRRYETIELLMNDLRHALISPDEDFVELTSYNQKKTRVISDDEVREIRSNTSDTKAEDESQEVDTGSADSEDEDDDDDDGFLNSRMEKVINILRVVVVIIIVLVVVYIIGNAMGVIKFSLFGNNNEEDTEEDTGTVVMVDLTGMTVEEAEEELADLGISVKKEGEEYSDEYDVDLIISQDVEEGETIEEGGTVYVVVSAGPEEEEEEEETETATVPNVVGNSSSTAMNTLESAGFVVVREFEYSSSVSAGTVISQSPSGGSEAEEGSTVTITVSQGSESTKVPYVVGETQADAESDLADAGLNVGTITEEYSDTYSEGTVISQSISSGSYVDMGTSVDLVISLGEEEVSYYVETSVSAPTNVTVLYADITLYDADTGTTIDSWEGITSFPYTVKSYGITGVTSAKLEIFWVFTDSNGDEGSYTQTAEVNLHVEQ